MSTRKKWALVVTALGLFVGREVYVAKFSEQAHVTSACKHAWVNAQGDRESLDTLALQDPPVVEDIPGETNASIVGHWLSNATDLDNIMQTKGDCFTTAHLRMTPTNVYPPDYIDPVTLSDAIACVQAGNTGCQAPTGGTPILGPMVTSVGGEPGSSDGGATAQCNDGTYSYAAHHDGACSHHGGVAIFYK